MKPFRYAALLALAMVALTAAGATCEGWDWLHPLPDGNTLLGAAHDGGLTVVVGYSGTVLRSTDGGSTWAPQALGSRADLLDVTFGGGLFVAVGEGGALYTSPDGATWTARDSGAALDLWAVTWNGSLFVAVGQGGQVTSSANGTSWSAAFIPELAGNTYLWGMVWTGSLFVAVGGDSDSYTTGTYTSYSVTSPDAATWTVHALDTTSPPRGWGGLLNDVAWNGSLFLAVGDSGIAYTSTDAASWTARDSGTDLWMMGVVWNGGSFAAVGQAGTTPMALTPDGVSWSYPPMPSGDMWDIELVEGTPARTAVFGWGGLLVVSDPLAGWIQKRPLQGDPLCYLYGVSAGDPTSLSGQPSVAVGYAWDNAAGLVLRSVGGGAWQPAATPSTSALYGIARGSSRYVAVGAGGTVGHSTDGDTWSWGTHTTRTLYGVCTDGGTGFALCGSSGTLATSADGATWTPRTSGTTTALRGIAWGGGRFVAVGSSGVVRTSADGVTWSPGASGVASTLYGVTYGEPPGFPGTFVAVGSLGVILTSTDGTTWTPRASGTPYVLRGVTWTGGQFVAVGLNGTALASGDGRQWTPVTTGNSGGFYAASSSPTAGVVGVGYAGQILTAPALWAVALATPTAGDPPLEVAFSASPVNPLATYAWDFGDGTWAPGPSANHTFSGPGTYTVTLRAEDCRGMWAQDRHLLVTAGDGSPRRVGEALAATTADGGWTIAVTWTATSCPSPDYTLLAGYGSGLPDWTLSEEDSRCALGTYGSYLWEGVPDPSADPSGFLWFLVVPTDGAGTEGSWGLTSGGQERGGGIASGYCGTTTRVDVACD